MIWYIKGAIIAIVLSASPSAYAANVTYYLSGKITSFNDVENTLGLNNLISK